MRIIKIVNFPIPNSVARSETWIPFSCLWFLSSSLLWFRFFYFQFTATIILLWPHGALFNKLYKKHMKHNEIQEKGWWIWAGLCMEGKLHCSWHSSTNTLGLSPHMNILCMVGACGTFHHLFLFVKFIYLTCVHTHTYSAYLYSDIFQWII